MQRFRTPDWHVGHLRVHVSTENVSAQRLEVGTQTEPAVQPFDESHSHSTLWRNEDCLWTAPYNILLCGPVLLPLCAALIVHEGHGCTRRVYVSQWAANHDSLDPRLRNTRQDVHDTQYFEQHVWAGIPWEHWEPVFRYLRTSSALKSLCVVPGTQMIHGTEFLKHVKAPTRPLSCSLLHWRWDKQLVSTPVLLSRAHS